MDIHRINRGLLKLSLVYNESIKMPLLGVGNIGRTNNTSTHVCYLEEQLCSHDTLLDGKEVEKGNGLMISPNKRRNIS